MDVLDVPIVNLLDSSFLEHHPQETQPVARPEGDARVRYGANMLPLEYEPTSLSAPVFTYPYSRSRETLEQLYRNGPIDPCHGVKLQYVNPATGGYPMPTIAAFLQLVPKGFSGETYRSTDSTIYNVVEGHGVSRSSWCRPGRRCRTRRTIRPCSSARPIARLRRRSGSGGKKHAFLPDRWYVSTYLSNRSDRPQFEHDDGNRDTGDAARARGG